MVDGSPLSARVLMTADTIGGVWSYALELSRSLGQRGVSVALATMGTPLSAEQWSAARALPHLEIFESDFKLEWMPDPWLDVCRSGQWLRELEDELQPDFIHLNSFAHGSLPWRAPALVVGHSCVLSWWQAVHGEPAPAEWSRYAQEVRRGLLAADVVAAPTGPMLDALEEHYGLPPVSLLIPNGRNAAQFAPCIKEEFILTAGRLSDQAKNLSALDSVASKLPWPVYAVGDGTRFNNVRKLGWQSPRCLAYWMGRASIYALPARYEPFGLSALEAALGGCALVLGDIPSLREVWGDTAIYVPPDDHYGLQGALEILIEDPSLRVDLAARARARALTFSACRMAERYVTAYKLAWDIRQSRPRRLTRCG